ncbi:MAG: ANTAR domain-containing protein [Oscillospiraceae bacterium]|nr:ANTAR domain-containing protein [Oscillospiraceae bacterium]
MVFRESTYSVLLVSVSAKFNEAMMPLLPVNEFWPVTVAKSVSEAGRRLLEADFDLVVINAPLPDDFGMQLAMDTCASSEAGVLLLVKSEVYDEVYFKVVTCGVVTLSKPTNERMIAQNLRVLCATRERLRRVEEKQVSVEEKIEEIRLMNRAKWLLIERLRMSEEAAHNYIIRQSMDMRISKREAAENVIRTYQ